MDNENNYLKPKIETVGQVLSFVFNKNKMSQNILTTAALNLPSNYS